MAIYYNKAAHPSQSVGHTFLENYVFSDSEAIHQNERNPKCRSVGCVVRLYGKGCGQGAWPRGCGLAEKEGGKKNSKIFLYFKILNNF